MANHKEQIIGRAKHVSYLVFALAFCIVGRLIYVQYFDTYQGRSWASWQEKDFPTITIPAMRGNIYAVDGSLMATSLPSYEVGLDPTVAKEDYFRSKADSLGLLLSRIYGDRSPRDYTQLVRDARRKKRQYVLLSNRYVTFAERQEMLKWPFFRSSGKVSARGGVLRAHYERYHPFGTMAERTIGNLDPETHRGQRGLEASFQTALAGRDAVGEAEKLSGGVYKPVVDGPDMKPEPGMDLHTTIDVNYQDMAESALRTTLEKYQAAKGCVVVMEVNTGEIRAMANLSRVEGKNGPRYIETFNHALAGGTDPGSTFKLATMMAMLERKVVSLNQSVATGDGIVKYGTRTIRDAHRVGFGTITARQVFEKSSNVGVHLLMRNYFYRHPDDFCRLLRQFHLDKKTGIHMLGEAQPLLPNPQMKGWSGQSAPSLALGYEMRQTPLQMLTLYNAIANDGYWVRPMLVRQVRLADEVKVDNKPYVSSERICSLSTVRQVQSLLRGVVENGTAKKIASPYYAIAGKTGTAQKIINGKYQVGKYSVSFIGYFPANKPKYSMVAMVDSPQGDNIDLLYAGAVAAPVFKEVADRIMAYDVQIQKPVRAGSQVDGPALMAGYADDLHTIDSVLGVKQRVGIEGWVEANKTGRWVERSTRDDQVPDVRGLSLRDALFLLENRGLRVAIQGRGKVTEQSVTPGTAIKQTPGRQISLTLKEPTLASKADSIATATKRRST